MASSATIDKLTLSTMIDSVVCFTYEVAGVPVDLTSGYTAELRLYQRDTGFSIDTFALTDISLGDDIGNIQVLVEFSRVDAYTVRAGTYEVGVNDGATDTVILAGCWSLGDATLFDSLTVVVYDSDEDAADGGIGFGESYFLSTGNIYGSPLGSEKTIADCV